MEAGSIATQFVHLWGRGPGILWSHWTLCSSRLGWRQYDWNPREICFDFQALPTENPMPIRQRWSFFRYIRHISTQLILVLFVAFYLSNVCMCACLGVSYLVGHRVVDHVLAYIWSEHSWKWPTTQLLVPWQIRKNTVGNFGRAHVDIVRTGGYGGPPTHPGGTSLPGFHALGSTCTWLW